MNITEILEDLKIEVAAGKILGYAVTEVRRIAVEVIKDRYGKDFSHLLQLGDKGIVQQLPDIPEPELKTRYKVVYPETLKEDVENLAREYQREDAALKKTSLAEKSPPEVEADEVDLEVPPVEDDEEFEQGLLEDDEAIQELKDKYLQTPLKNPDPLPNKLKPFLARDLGYDPRPEYLTNEKLFLTVPKLAAYFAVSEPAIQERLKHSGFQGWSQTLGWQVTTRGSMYAKRDTSDLTVFNYKWNLQAIKDATTAIGID